MSLGHGLIDSLESIHNAGYTYNDLKPSNILLQENGQKFEHDQNQNILKGKKVVIIDFGFTEPYLKEGAHIQ